MSDESTTSAAGDPTIDPQLDTPTPGDAPPGGPPQAAAGETPPSTAPAAAPPAGVSKEEYDLLATKVEQTNNQLQQALGALGTLAAQGQQQATPAVPEVTDEQLAAMYDSGEGAQILKANRILQERSDRQHQTQVQQLREEVTGIAVPIVAKVAQADMPHYGEFKNDIDAYLATLPPAALTNPKVHEIAYGVVASKPENMKRIVDREVEARMRQARESSEASAPGGPAGRVAPPLPAGVPTFEQAFPDDKSGINADDFARKLGYDGWVDYWQKTEIEGEA
jgi:hypothetical protein